MSIKKLTNPREFFETRLEQAYASASPMSEVMKEFDEYEVTREDRKRLILNSPFGKDPKIRGLMELFG
jgi:hypothetical protein